ncbi:MAG TPA: hypothetical protein VMV79_01310, partial [Alphaproteobacteria bacterium]|nr:hypothetical protein [Alphaproteobacteria bacterium]
DVRLLDAQKRDKDDAAAPKPEIHYEARMPYADLRMRFGPDARVVLISVFGKRGVMLGVPPFLDEALKPARKALADAARGGGPLDDALKARALHDALALELGGKRQAADLRRLYPVGLTADTAGEIMREMRLALGRFTRRERAIAAAGGGLIGAGLLAGWFLTPLHARALPGLPWQAALAVDLCAFILILGLARIGLGASAQFALQRRFPNLRISLRRSVGVIGYAMLGFIAAAGAASIWFAPLRPLWLDYLLRLIAQR